MFRNNNSRNNSYTPNNAPVRKPYCKVCHDAGKSESEYTSHYVRTLPDKTGKTNVTCPTLLNLSCRFCGKNGHTVKFCQEIANMKKTEERKKKAEEHQAKEAREAKKESTTRRMTGFAALQIDSDEEEDDILEPVQPIQPIISGYAAALMKPKPVSAPKPATAPDRIGEFKAITIQSGVKCEKDDDDEEDETSKRMKYAKKCKWMEDSDDEEEEEEDNSAW